MTREQWAQHMADLGFKTTAVLGSAEYEQSLVHMRSDCPECVRRVRTIQRTRDRRNRSQVLRDLGMTRTKYGWE